MKRFSRSAFNECDFLNKVLPLFKQCGAVRLGPGDDCAVLAASPAGFERVVTVDPVVCGIHFSPDTAPALAAEKLVKRNLSDLAAMGATPEWGVLSVACGAHRHNDLPSFFQAVARVSADYAFPICGGDLTALPQPNLWMATLTLGGLVPQGRAVTRSGGKVGDVLLVTGLLGNSFASGHHLQFSPRLNEGRFLAEKGVHAMLDISDGLAKDAMRLAQASGVGAALNLRALPLRRNATAFHALHDGEDYELLFAADPETAAAVLREWPFETPLRRIGMLCAEPGLYDETGAVLSSTGWDPFTAGD